MRRKAAYAEERHNHETDTKEPERLIMNRFLAIDLPAPAPGETISRKLLAACYCSNSPIFKWAG